MRERMKIIRIGPSANYKNVNDKKTNAVQKTASVFTVASTAVEGGRTANIALASRKRAKRLGGTVFLEINLGVVVASLQQAFHFGRGDRARVRTGASVANGERGNLW